MVVCVVEGATVVDCVVVGATVVVCVVATVVDCVVIGAVMSDTGTVVGGISVESSTVPESSLLSR